MNALLNNKIVLNQLSLADDTQLMLSVLSNESHEVNLDNAGTCMRFLTAYYACKANKNISLLAEAELLKLLCQKQNQVLTREEALLAIWHDDNYFNGRSMDVFLSKLRKYLKADPKVEIMNVHGRGYKLFIH